MAIAATYVSSVSFTVSGDVTDDFLNGIAVRADCGGDGIKYCFVDYSSYSNPNTTVYLNATESQAITANLISVSIGRMVFNNVGGNIPLDLLWALRGRQSIGISYKDADEISLSAGSVHIDDDTNEHIYYCSGFDKQLTSVGTSEWRYIYVKPPANGLVITASEIEHSTTAPTIDITKNGWYHGTNTTWRCIGFVWINSGGNIVSFYLDGNIYRFKDVPNTLSYVTFTTSTNATPTVPLPNILVLMWFRMSRVSLDVDVATYIGASSSVGWTFIGSVLANARDNSLMVLILTGSDSQITVGCTSGQQVQVTANTLGFIIPKWFYN